MKTTTYRSKKPRLQISDALRASIIDYFETNYNNTMPDICAHFDIDMSIVRSVMRQYFKTKNNNK